MHRRHGVLGNEGFVLISGYLLLSLLLLYSSGLTMRTLNQGLISDRSLEKYQSLDLARGAAEQLQTDLYRYLTINVYQLQFQGDAIAALTWLDQRDDLSGDPLASPETPKVTEFNALKPALALGTIDKVLVGNGTSSDTRKITLASLSIVGDDARGQGEAWIARVTGEDMDGDNNLDAGEDLNKNGALDDPKARAPWVPNALSPRVVTVRARATGANGVARNIKSAYVIDLQTSDVFQNAYFINNYGWFNVNPYYTITINGEVRSNGNVDFTGSNNNVFINGTVAAAKNPELRDPRDTTWPYDTADGSIDGDPREATIFAYSGATPNPPSSLPIYDKNYDTSYWLTRPDRARPELDLALYYSRTSAGVYQPWIGGTPTPLKTGGWNSEYPNLKAALKDTEQEKLPKQQPQTIPYLGDLSLYKNKSQNAQLTYTKNGKTISVIDASGNYLGPDGKAGSGDEKSPLILDGTKNPIQINGGVVIPTDVIIKGIVSGRGTIYSGRNVHIVGSIQYQDPPSWPALERNATDGTVRVKDASGVLSNLGKVCNNGTYLAPGGGSCK